MKFMLRKTEREAIQDALVQEKGTVAEAAKAVWDASLEEFLKRQLWIVLVTDPGVGSIPWGPYPTPDAAHKAIEKGDIFAASPGASAVVVRLKSVELDNYFMEEAE